MTSDAEPTRRQRIIDATLECISKEGLEGTTMRRVAQFANVSVGAITHHFADRDALLIESMLYYTDQSLHDYRTFFHNVTSLEQARASIVKLLTTPARSRLDSIVGSELYAISLRRPRYRLVLDRWTRESRAIMSAFFDEETVAIIDALYEGLLLHRRMHLGDYPDELVVTAVKRLTPEHTYIGPRTA